jgi:hypothetical protein
MDFTVKNVAEQFVRSHGVKVARQECKSLPLPGLSCPGR